jgi:hypothetical protein
VRELPPLKLPRDNLAQAALPLDTAIRKRVEEETYQYAIQHALDLQKLQAIHAGKARKGIGGLKITDAGLLSIHSNIEGLVSLDIYLLAARCSTHYLPPKRVYCTSLCLSRGDREPLVEDKVRIILLLQFS